MNGWKRGRSLTRAGTVVFVVAAAGYFVAVGPGVAGENATRIDEAGEDSAADR